MGPPGQSGQAIFHSTGCVVGVDAAVHRVISNRVFARRKIDSNPQARTLPGEGGWRQSIRDQRWNQAATGVMGRQNSRPPDDMCAGWLPSISRVLHGLLA